MKHLEDYCLLYNPLAGSGKCLDNSKKLADALKKAAFIWRISVILEIIRIFLNRLRLMSAL